MSVLDFPRIHFRGKCLINAATGNNDDVAINIDTARATLNPELRLLGADHARDWMMQSFRAKHLLNNQLHWYLKAGWNYFGDMSVRFKDVQVSAVTGIDGKSRPHDHLIGQPVAIRGTPDPDAPGRVTPAVICDLDPTGPVLTQLFLGGFSLGTEDLGLIATCNARAFARWIGWRNASTYDGEQNYPGAGATFQFVIPFEALEYARAEESSVLGTLRDVASEAAGIVVQFAVYQPIPGISDEELIQRFRRGDHVKNPVEALLVGTIGVWKERELRTVPAGRLLLPAFPTVIGPAVAKVQPDRDVVSLNLISAFPEADFFDPPVKYDFGSVRLGVIPAAGGDPVEISDPIAYDHGSYATHGGIVDVPYDPGVVSRGQLERGTLVLLFNPDLTGSTTPLLSEAGSTVTVETDDRGVYLDVGDVGEVEILVQERGGPPGRDVAVYLWDYQSVLKEAEFQVRASSAMTPVSARSGQTPRISFPRSVIFPAGRTDPLPVRVRAQNPGAVALAFTLDGWPLPDGFPWATASYGGVRVLPDDDFDHVPIEDRVEWPFVFENIFMYYHVVYPAMSKVIPFNDQAAMERRADDLVEATDPTRKDSTLYMPISRDLSTGKRRLLVEWADEVARSRGGGSGTSGNP